MRMTHECKALDALGDRFTSVAFRSGMTEPIKKMRCSGYYKLDEQTIQTTKTASVKQSMFFNGSTLQIYNTVRVGRDTWDEEPTEVRFNYCPFCGEKMRDQN